MVKADITTSFIKLELPLDSSYLFEKQLPDYRQEVFQVSLLKNQKLAYSFALLLLTSWVCLMYRYHQQEEVTIGIPLTYFNEKISTRLPDTLYPLKVNFKNKITALQVLTTIQKKVQAASLNSPDSLSQFNVALTDLKFIKTSPVCSNVDLGLSFDFSANLEQFNYQLQLFYNANLFKASTINRIINHIKTLLLGIIKNPNQLVDKLPLLTPSETTTLLQQWTNTKKDYPKYKTIHELFENQAVLTPKAVAIVYNDQEITYQELNEKSNQVAYYLQNIGVKKESLVGLYLERSVNTIIGILAILKAGGAYLPLDPAAPPERLKTIIEDAEISLIITQTSYLNSLQEIPKTIRIVCLDKNANFKNFPHKKPPINQVNENNLAYVMYTSGSTGKPKGVCILHRGVIRLVKNTNYAEFGKDEVVLQLASIAFDAATFEIWSPLLNGGKLVLIPEKMPSLQDIATAIQTHKITTIWLTAGLFHVMIDEKLEALQPLKQLLAGGDVLSVPHVRKVLENLPNCQLINGYGPTENTTFTCCYKITKNDAIKDSIPIGYPIANTQVYILDHHLQLVPIGIPGELYIGGDGLARGYLNKSDLTKERFIQNPFSNDPNSRLYKTGDRVRWNEDGKIEFIGRTDFQVKVRGYRVELGEIEAVLGKHCQVQSSVVLATENNSNGKQLVAYIVPKTEITSTELRQFLSDKLPDYMIPSRLIFLKQFPLNVNGKIDRKKLLALSSSDQPVKKNIIFPRTPIETKLVNIWQEILGKPISIDHRFTELGGNSLQGIQIISRIRDLLNIELPVQILLQGSTLEELAAIIETSTPQENLLNWSTLSLKSLTNNLCQNNKNFPLSLYQERMWLMNQLTGKSPVFNLPIIFQLEGILNIASLEKAINQIIQRHETLRTFFPVIEGFPVQKILPTFSISLELIPNLEQEEIKQQIKSEIIKTFELDKKPPIRCFLIQLSEKNTIFVMVVHHLIVDGWSLGIIVQEVSSLYNALINNDSCSLPSLSLQYKDFSSQHRQWLQQANVYDSLVDYWSKKLNNRSPYLDLQTDYPRPTLRTFEGRIESFHIDANLTQKLQTLSQETNATLYIILVATFLLLLYRHSHQKDLVIGVPVANRNRTEIESTIGFFSNVVPLAASYSERITFLQWVNEVKKVILDTYYYQEFPLEAMLNQLGGSRDFSSIPWFQVVFNFLNVPSKYLTLSGIKSHSMIVEKPSAFYEIMVLSWETPEGIEGIFEYNSNLFSQNTIKKFIKEFKFLLQDVVKDSLQNINKLALISDEKKTVNSHQSRLKIINNKSILNKEKINFFQLQDPDEVRLTNIWKKVLKIDCLTVQSNFFELGGNSLLAMAILAKIEKEFKVNLSLSTFLQNPTIEEINKLIKDKDKNSNLEESSVLPIQTKGNNSPLFFINSLSQAKKVATHLDKDQPFYILSILGIARFLDRKLNQLTLEEIAAKFIADMQKLQPEGPYHLISYCGDSWLTFEVAQQLEKKGYKIPRLILIDAFWKPQHLGLYLHRYNLSQFGINYLVELCKSKLFWTQEKLIARLKQIQTQYYYRVHKPLPRALEDIKILKAFEAARNNYSPQPYSGKIILFVSQEYRLLGSSKLADLATEGIEIQEIPGYHHTLFQEPYINVLVDKLNDYL